MSKCNHTNREPYENYSGTVTMYSCQDCEAFVSLGQHEWMKRAEKAEAEVEKLSKRQREDEAAFWEERDARVELQARVEKLEAERKEIFWIMLQVTERGSACQYRERRWSDPDKWVDCAESGPVWDWTDYEYRIKTKADGENK